MEEFRSVLEVSALPENASAVVELDDISVLVCRSGGEFFAVRNICSHQSKPLTGGRVRNGCIFCPHHGMRFKLATGEPLGQLTSRPLTTIETRIESGQIQIRLNTDDQPA